MSIKRRQLFVGVIDNEKWTNEKLRTYLTKHSSTNDDQYIINCEFMSYTEAKFQGKSFAFVTFTDQICVDRCMEKRSLFNEEYGLTLKRLLPDSISKCQRLVSSPDIVIRITLPDVLFTEENIRAFFGKYGQILDLKMLEEDKTGGICFIAFEDFDSTDRILLDSPHYLNGQLLSIHKYTSPEYVTSLSQYRFVDRNNAHKIKRWQPILRNFTDLIRPLEILYKTQLALLRYNIKKQISIRNNNLDEAKEKLFDSENQYNNFQKKFLQLSQLNNELKQKIEENQRKVQINKNQYEEEIERQREKNETIEKLIDNS